MIDGARSPQSMVPIVEVLCGVERPASILTWKRSPRVQELLTGLASGDIPLTHQGLDEASTDKGDTMLIDSLEDIPRRYPDIDLGLIHTGATTFLVTVVTMTGEQAVKAVKITKPRTAIPIHYNDFSVFRSGLDDFKKAAAASTTSTRFVYVTHGETYTFKPTG